MKDVTSTSFGLIIGFLLPGLVALYSLSFWSPLVETLFLSFLTAQSNVGLFLMVVMAGIAAGLQVTALRWVVFECIICQRDRLRPSEFAALGSSEGKLAAFRAAVDEHYRYHQFWGGVSVVMPLLFVGWLKSTWASLSFWQFCGALLAFAANEGLAVAAGITAYRNYITKARRILEGDQNA